jgi:hypothetical protein
VALTGNAMLMRARIEQYTDDATGISYADVPPLLSPSLIANVDGRWQASRFLELGAAVRHVGQSQLANDGSATQVLPAATLADLRASVKVGRVELRRSTQPVRCQRLRQCYTTRTTRYLFPVAERTLLTTLVIHW